MLEKRPAPSAWIFAVAGVVLILVLSVVALLCHEIYLSNPDARVKDETNIDEIAPSLSPSPFNTSSNPLPFDWHCTMEYCFNRTKCGNSVLDFKFFLYPRPDNYDPYEMYEPTFPAYNKERARVLWDEMYEAFARSPYRTMLPHEACLFIPFFDMTASATVTTRSSVNKIERSLYALPYWNGNGQNHVVFDRHEDDVSPYNPQHALLFRASLHTRHMRRHFDHGWQFRPEYFPCAFSNNATIAKAFRSVPLHKRSSIGYFRGIQSHPLRTKMMQCYAKGNEEFLLSNPSQLQLERNLQDAQGRNDTIMQAQLEVGINKRKRLFSTENYYKYYFGKATDESRIPVIFQDSQAKGFVQGDYCSLFGTALLGLNPRGKGLLTYRTMEILRIGAIHVYIGDDYSLPYDDILDWNTFSILVPELYSCELNTILSASNYPPEKLQQMQTRANYLYDTYFETFEKELSLIWASLLARIYRDWRKPADLDLLFSAI